MAEKWSDYLNQNPEMFNGNTVVALFRKAMEHDPKHIALVSEDGSCTYEELEKKSNQIARHLEKLGVGSGKIVAVKSGRSFKTVAAILGVWKTGAAYAYFDSDSPKDYNDYILELCKAEFTVGSDFIEDAIATESDDYYEEKGVFDRLAVIIFTSGSTGHPKGVMLKHRSLVSSASNCCLVLGINSGDHFGFFASFMFIAFVNDLCTTLIVGATGYLIPKSIRKHIKEIAQYYIDNEITITYLPPIMARKYMDMPQSPYLNLLMVGSEPTRNLRKQSYRIINIYASSEGSSIISYFEVSDNRVEYPIGQVLPTYRYYVVDDCGNPCKDGEMGELWLSGPQLFCGYLNQQELTAEKLIPNPFPHEEGFDYVFKTADMVSEGPDGLVYRGRRDNMVKVRGFRIELTGVEQDILKFQGIKEACCTVHMDDGGTNILFAYFTSDEKIDHGRLRAFLTASLPYYMVPMCLIQLDAFPLTPSGKVARKQIPAPAEINDREKLKELYS